jgi:hypothetical protein
LRFAAGELAKIVEKYGFISKPTYQVSTGMWRGINKQSGPRPHPNSDSPFFPFAWKWNDKMASLMFEYNELREKVQAIEDGLKNLKQEKEQSEAEDLWNLA